MLTPVLLWSAACAWVDFRTRKIPNWLTGPAAVAGLAFLTLFQSTPVGGNTPASAGIGVLLVLSLTLPGLALRQLGGGDIKMLLAIALLAGAAAAMTAFVVASLVVAVTFLGLSISRRLRPSGGSAATGDIEAPAPPLRIPWGPGLALGLALYAGLLHVHAPAA